MSLDKEQACMIYFATAYDYFTLIKWYSEVYRDGSTTKHTNKNSRDGNLHADIPERYNVLLFFVCFVVLPPLLYFIVSLILLLMQMYKSC